MAFSAPRMVTSVPGPQSQTFLVHQDEVESNARSYPRGIPIAIKKALGAYVQDMDGNVFIDFLSAAGALPLGHNPPCAVAAVNAQMESCSQALDIPTPAKQAFNDAVLGLLPPAMAGRMKLHFCGPTGADAVEASIKLAKFVTGRSNVFSFQGGYHGCTNGAMAVTGLLGPKEGVANPMAGVQFFPYSHCYRCPLGLARSTCSVNCIRYLENTLQDPNGGSLKPAAVILEMLQGEGGVIPAQREFAQTLRRITREHGIVLIVDEIQTGCGRTGNWFAFEQYGIEPDVILLSKGIGGMGLPVSVMAFDRKLDTWPPGKHIGTFRGNQLAFAAGVAVLKEMREQNVLHNVALRGEQLRTALLELQQRHAFIGDVRGIGLMQGCEIIDPASGAINPKLAARIRKAALSRGLILELGGRDDCVVRFLPPLNVSSQTMQQAMEILAAAMDDVAPAEMAPETMATDDVAREKVATNDVAAAMAEAAAA